VKLPAFAAILFSVAWSAGAQQDAAPTYTDPMALLQAVAANYAGAADGFRLESVIDFDMSGELTRQWSRTYRTAIKGPGSQYRIEVRTGFGSLLQLSDGSNEWIYQVESNSYVKRPLPPDWPRFPRVRDSAFHELTEAWNARTYLEDEALGYKQATMLPEEAIVIDGRRYACYVVQASLADSVAHRNSNSNEYRGEMTFWVDKQALVFRKTRRITDAQTMVSKNLRVPAHMETTEIFPVAEVSPQIGEEMFRFTPPADAKEVASLDPDPGRAPSPLHPKAEMAGQMAPAITFADRDGQKMELSAYRGKPLLIDFWATWCGPCLLSMPGLSRIYAETKDKGLQLISFDHGTGAEDSAVYMKHHHYDWPSYHDEGNAVFDKFKAEGVPLVVLIDPQGKIVYYDFGNQEQELRRAIASLGPASASVAATPAGGTGKD